MACSDGDKTTGTNETFDEETVSILIECLEQAGYGGRDRASPVSRCKRDALQNETATWDDYEQSSIIFHEYSHSVWK